MNTTVTREQVVDFLSNMPTIELADLIRELEVRWNVTAAPVVQQGPQPLPGTPDVDVKQTEFTVTLTDAGTNKIQVIKSVRQTLGLGLKEAKDLVESVPKLLKDGISKIEAAELQAEFEAAGAKVDVR
jgi:large subunit ribosomal protein L7/L12